ncbi:hypothetical protein BABINDRAFT_96369 [Babjeviella inositovora NRRL Y-12698]|uniref:Uncharacterized protein n=1 Tax=Babjeviella inositovora NRRL Y-12698 TaxID=984486 RepID=A0A1E3QIS3_9ASCO|nr:uncharacterized protein BABINDRAFT_96369 [Babjeviella inositovora NRRL Y-12698]ODQ77591.1 hypothetical protein BABINDRAFT_96369 [Babjeviella inositovora NRRL Y-12698]
MAFNISSPNSGKTWIGFPVKDLSLPLVGLSPSISQVCPSASFLSLVKSSGSALSNRYSEASLKAIGVKYNAVVGLLRIRCFKKNQVAQRKLTHD